MLAAQHRYGTQMKKITRIKYKPLTSRRESLQVCTYLMSLEREVPVRYFFRKYLSATTAKLYLDLPHCWLAGLWIRIHFLRIRIQMFFSMQIWIQRLFSCGSGSSLKKFVTNNLMKSFLELNKSKMIAQCLITKELVQIYLFFFFIN